MLDVINLALPFFGLIFLGLLCGKLKQIPETGLAWMNFFLIYVSLPSLFYRVLAQTPLKQLTNPRFIVATALATATMFALSFAIGWLFRRHLGEAVLMAALPPALNVFIMARQYDTWVAQASGSVLFGTFVSVVTLTTTMWLVKAGMLPTTLFR